MAGTLSITNDNFQAGQAIVASQMNTNFTEVENYINNSMPSLGVSNTFTAAVTMSSTFTVSGTTTLAAVTFNGTLSGTNSVPRMAYNGGGAATVASHQMNSNPTIFINPAANAPVATSTGDLWVAI